MKLSSCLSALFVSIFALGADVYAKTPEEYEREFKAYLRENHLTFEDALVYAQRLENYISNDLFIMKHNELSSSSFTLGHNQYSHMTFNEFSNMKKGFVMPSDYLAERMNQTSNSYVTKNEIDVPDSVDWVTKGGVTPVKNQGQCGSCWAFSTTGAVEGAAFVASGKLPSLSEQELVDCDHDGDNGCNGGLMDHAFHWIDEHGGICTEEEYAYHGAVETCHKCQSVVKVTGFTDVESNNEQALKEAVAKQPVSVAIEADQREFQFYKSGVFDLKCGTQLDHGVLVVGYGSEDGKKFWKVKNSWGPTWGKDGFILLSREMGDAAGQCGVAMVPSYPTAILVSATESERDIKNEQVEELEQYLQNIESDLPVLNELEEEAEFYGASNDEVFVYFPDSN